MNVTETIKRETKEFADKLAVIEADRGISYGELFAAVEQTAAELKKYGLQPAQRVALLCPDSIDYIIVTLAVLKAQAVIVPISPSLSGDEVEQVLKRMDANFFIFEQAAHSRDNARPILSALEKSFFLYSRVARGNLPADYYALNPAFIRFSSGTTGASKGIVLSHQAIIQRTDAADKGLRMSPDDVVIWILSMSFHFVVSILLFLRRAATILLCGQRFPESLRKALSRHKGTFIYASPFHYHILTKSDLFTPGMLKGIRLAVSTAVGLPKNTAAGFYEKFGFELSQAYGIIEVGLPFLNFPPDKTRRCSAGKILPDYEAKIVNPDCREGVGEIRLKGKGMFDAYFSPWRRRGQLLPEGWFNTGDLGKLDADGYLFLLGRQNKIINFCGMKIFPTEVEAALNRHPAVKESFVYGAAHPRYGQIPCAKVVLKGDTERDLDDEALRRFCYQHLAIYKVPKEFHRVTRLDKTPSGKLRR